MALSPLRPRSRAQPFLSTIARPTQGVDERTSSESLLEMVSRDFRCLRSMRVDYLDAEGERQTLTGSGSHSAEPPGVRAPDE